MRTSAVGGPFGCFRVLFFNFGHPKMQDQGWPNGDKLLTRGSRRLLFRRTLDSISRPGVTHRRPDPICQQKGSSASGRWAGVTRESPPLSGSGGGAGRRSLPLDGWWEGAAGRRSLPLVGGGRGLREGGSHGNCGAGQKAGRQAMSQPLGGACANAWSGSDPRREDGPEASDHR